MKKLLIMILLALVAPHAAMAARQVINNSEGMGSVRSKINAMTTELYALSIAAPWLAQTTAPSITNVFWVDTSGTEPVIKYHNGSAWVAASSGGDGTYTLPVATSSVLGGVKQGAGTSVAADGTISVTKSGLGLGTTDNAVFGSVNAAGGTLSAGVANTTQGTLILYTNTDPIYAFGLSPAASPSAIVSIKAPGAMPTVDNSLLNFDINGTGGWTDPATFLTPSGSGASLTVDASGFNGNLATTDNTLQEIAQKVDDITDGSGTDDQTAAEVAVTATGFDGNLATTDDTVQKVAQKLDDLVIGGSAVTDATITTTDVTTNNASTTKHGWMPKSVAPAAGMVNFYGIANGETAPTNKALFDATSPSTQAFGDAAAVGSAVVPARRDHKHAMPANPMVYPSSNNFAWTTNGTSWTSMGLDTNIVTGVSASDDTIPSAKAVDAALALKANASSIAFEAATWADLKILDTTHATEGTGIALVQDSMAYTNDDDAYHLWSIDKIGSELAGKQASDADLTDLADGSLTGSKVGFADTDGLWTASNIEAALVEMNDSINTGAPNGTGAKVHWSQLLGVPAGFADGSDDGTGGGITHAASDGTYYSSRNGAWASFTSGDYTLAMTLSANTAITLPTSGTLIASGGAIGAATATTPSANDNDTSVATTAYVQTEIAATASDSLTLTNKTLDTAGTGNAITVPLNGVLDGAITDPADADDMIYKKVQNAMTLTDIHCLAEGGGSITLTLQECSTSGGSCANIEGAITCDADGAEDDGTLTDGAIAAGAWVKVLYSAPTGTVNNVAWTVYGTQTW